MTDHAHNGPDSQQTTFIKSHVITDPGHNKTRS